MPFNIGFTIIIIPLREKTGNYDLLLVVLVLPLIIPLREKTGNYDLKVVRAL